MKTIKDIKIKGKKVLLRTDYDVPLDNGEVVDDSRIQASLPTISYLLEKKATSIVILCHLDRPGGKVIKNLRVEPVKELLKTLLPQEVPVDFEENLRFNPGEKENNLQFAEKLAEKGNLFVNDAFAVSHRNHASIISLPKLLPSAIGLHFEKEIEVLNRVLKNPKRPFIFIIGGAKLETKLPIIEKLARKADKILVGGKLAQEIGSACSPEAMACISVAQVKANGKDITQKSAQAFTEKINKAGTVVWNGPMGVFEEDQHSLGTKIIAQSINQAPGFTVIGGGDTEAAATKFKAEENIDYISSGGGAMLTYMAKGTLPGLEAILNSRK